MSNSKSLTFADINKPIIRPNKPTIEPNISIMRTLTKSCASAASAMAQVEPVIPTHTPQKRFDTPTVMPAQNNAYPNKIIVNPNVFFFKSIKRDKPEKYEVRDQVSPVPGMDSAKFIFEEKMMAMMTP